jgi:putative ubiquitin-RnfH superfamily antitoxin RatB of RatAB toxin-antitoxin module
MENTQLVQNINNDMAIALPETVSLQQLRLKLSVHINDLIKNNFETLLALLYRIDVSEKKLKDVLSNNPTLDAGDIIADLIIERQQQKITFKQQFTGKSSGNSNEEKW